MEPSKDESGHKRKSENPTEDQRCKVQVLEDHSYSITGIQSSNSVAIAIPTPEITPEDTQPSKSDDESTVDNSKIDPMKIPLTNTERANESANLNDDKKYELPASGNNDGGPSHPENSSLDSEVADAILPKSGPSASTCTDDEESEVVRVKITEEKSSDLLICDPDNYETVAVFEDSAIPLRSVSPETYLHQLTPVAEGSKRDSDDGSDVTKDGSMSVAYESSDHEYEDSDLSEYEHGGIRRNVVGELGQIPKSADACAEYLRAHCPQHDGPNSGVTVIQLSDTVQKEELSSVVYIQVPQVSEDQIMEEDTVKIEQADKATDTHNLNDEAEYSVEPDDGNEEVEGSSRITHIETRGYQYLTYCSELQEYLRSNAEALGIPFVRRRQETTSREIMSSNFASSVAYNAYFGPQNLSTLHNHFQDVFSFMLLAAKHDASLSQSYLNDPCRDYNPAMFGDGENIVTFDPFGTSNGFMRQRFARILRSRLRSRVFRRPPTSSEGSTAGSGAGGASGGGEGEPENSGATQTDSTDDSNSRSHTSTDQRTSTSDDEVEEVLDVRPESYDVWNVERALERRARRHLNQYVPDSSGEEVMLTGQWHINDVAYYSETESQEDSATNDSQSSPSQPNSTSPDDEGDTDQSDTGSSNDESTEDPDQSDTGSSDEDSTEEPGQSDAGSSEDGSVGEPDQPSTGSPNDDLGVPDQSRQRTENASDPEASAPPTPSTYGMEMMQNNQEVFDDIEAAALLATARFMTSATVAATAYSAAESLSTSNSPVPDSVPNATVPYQASSGPSLAEEPNASATSSGSESNEGQLPLIGHGRRGHVTDDTYELPVLRQGPDSPRGRRFGRRGAGDPDDGPDQADEMPSTSRRTQPYDPGSPRGRRFGRRGAGDPDDDGPDQADEMPSTSRRTQPYGGDSPGGRRFSRRGVGDSDDDDPDQAEAMQSPSQEPQRQVFERRDRRGNQVLHRVAERGDVQRVVSLLQHGASHEGRGWRRRTPLHSAAAAGHVDVVRVLLDFGSRIDTEDANGYTPLDLSEKYQHNEVTELLLQRGADPESTAARRIAELNTIVRMHSNAMVPIVVRNATTMRWIEDYLMEQFLQGRIINAHVVFSPRSDGSNPFFSGL